MKFQFPGHLQTATSAPARTSLLQTSVLSDLVAATAVHANVGCFNVDGQTVESITNLPIDEDAMLAVAVTPQIAVAWGDQTADWLIPFNETDSQARPVGTLLQLGNGPMAFDYPQCAHTLERIKEHLLVAYVFADCVGVVRYRWNERLLDSLNQLHQATTLYEMLAESRSDEVVPTPVKALHEDVIYGRIHVDGSAEMWR